MNGDNSLIKGTITGKDGFFEIAGITNNKKAILVAKFVGYKEYRLAVELSTNQNIDTIFLDKDDNQLDEIVVKGKVDARTADRMIIYPKQKAIESSSDAWDVIGKMRLPGVSINKTANSITYDGKPVIIKIDGRDAQVEEVMTLKPDEISRIELIDRPGTRYAEQKIGAILLVKTTHNAQGFAAGYRTTCALNTMQTNHNVYLQYNKGNYQVQAQYSNKYRNYKHVKNFTELTLKNGDDKFSFEKCGDEYSPYQYLQQNTAVQYNYYKDGYLFNAKFSGGFYNNFQNTDEIQNIYSDNVFLCKSISDPHEKYAKPSLDLYTEIPLNCKSKLILNVVSEFLKTDYEYDYREFDANNDVAESYIYNVSGKKMSLITEGVYQKEWDKAKMSAGAKFKTSDTKNDYLGDIFQKFTAKYNDYYGYVEGRFDLGKFNASAGIGASVLDYKEDQNTYNDVLWRPLADLSYNPNQKWSFSTSFQVSPYAPDMSMINSSRKMLDRYEVTVGNIDLKPYLDYDFESEISYSNDVLYSSLTYELEFANNIFDEYAYSEDARTIGYTQMVYDNYRVNAFSAYLSIDVVPDVFSITADGGVTYYDYNLSGQHFKLDSWNYSVDLELYAGEKWYFEAAYEKNPWRLYGMQQYYNVGYTLLEIDYKMNKNIKFGVMWCDPLKKYNKSSSYKYEGNGIYKVFENDFYDTANSVVVTFAWTFSGGKEYKTSEKKLNNYDTGDGIIK